MKKIWIDLNEEIHNLHVSGNYLPVELDIQTINPASIVSLSRELDQTRLEGLRRSIRENGWLDLSPSTIDLIMLPDGRYIVSSGGNHRAVVSNEFDIKEIKAKVTAYLPKSLLNEANEIFIEEEKKVKDDLYKIYRLETDWEIRSKIYQEISNIDQKLNDYLVGIFQRANST